MGGGLKRRTLTPLGSALWR